MDDVYSDPKLIDRSVRPEELDAYYREVSSYEFAAEIGEAEASFPYPVSDRNDHHAE